MNRPDTTPVPTRRTGLRGLLERHATLSERHPLRVLILLSAPFLALTPFALSTPVDLSFAGIMDRDNPEIERYFRLSRRYQLGGELILLLSGPESRIDDVASALERDLAGSDLVRSAYFSMPTQWLTENAIWIAERPVFDAWVRLVRDPSDLDNARFLREEMEIPSNLDPTRLEGMRLIQVRLKENPLDVALGNASFFELAAQAEELIAQHPGFTAEFSGLPAIAAQDQTRTLGTIRRLSPFSLLLVLLVFSRIERRLVGLAVVVFPLLLAISATLGAMGLVLGKITVMETFFGVTIFGLGIDFTIHLIVRQQEELLRERRFASALVSTLRGTGRGVIAGALTTAGAFFVTAAAPDPVALHLGLSGGIGLLFCLILVVGMMPPLWALLDRHGLGAASPAPSTERVSLVMHTATIATRHPRICLLVSGLLMGAALAGAPRFRVETDLQKVFNRDVPAVATVERIQDLFELNTAPWVMGVDNLDQTRELEAQFKEEPLFSRTESIARFFPSDQPERQSILTDLRSLVSERLEQAETLQQAGAGPEIAAFRDAMELLRDAERRGPPGIEDLPPTLRERFVAPDGTLLFYAYAAKPTFDGEQAAVERRAAQAIHPDATALATLLEGMLAAERPWVKGVAAGILAFVVIVLAVDLRSFRYLTLALVPVILGTLSTFGILCWLGIGFNVMTSLVVPLIVGLGVDDGIHVAHRLKEKPEDSPAAAAGAVGRAILMTTATTCSSFLVLLFTNHAGLESMALVMLIGLPLCLLASITTLPALATLWPAERGAQ